MIFDNLINFLNNGWVGSILGIFGVLIAIFTYLKPFKPQISTAYNSYNLLNSKNSVIDEKVEILFKGKKITNLYFTKFTFWNSGRTSIKATDFPDNSFPIINFGAGNNILEAEVLSFSNSHNKVEIIENYDPNHLNIKLSYLDPKDGVTVKVLSSGNLPELSVHGALIGNNDGLKKSYKISHTKVTKSDYIGIFIFYFFSFIFASFSFISLKKEWVCLFFTEKNCTNFSNTSFMFFYVITFIMIILTIRIYKELRRYIPKKLR